MPAIPVAERGALHVVHYSYLRNEVIKQSTFVCRYLQL